MSTRIILKITGMECPNCAMILEQMEDKLPGVLRAEASYHKAQLTVDYDLFTRCSSDLKSVV